jgi:hypothetical protein
MGKHTDKPCQYIHNRSTDGLLIFRDDADYTRFLHLLYRANSTIPVHFTNTSNPFELEQRKPLVDIVAYSLLPDSFHIILKDRNLRSKVKKFMHKLCTAYSMYYKSKYYHAGSLFHESYSSDELRGSTLREMIAKIHDLPASLNDPKRYQFSSYKEYLGIDRPQKVILMKKSQEFIDRVSTQEDQ